MEHEAGGDSGSDIALPECPSIGLTVFGFGADSENIPANSVLEFDGSDGWFLRFNVVGSSEDIAIDEQLAPNDIRVPRVGERFTFTSELLPNAATTNLSYYRIVSEDGPLWYEGGAVLPTGANPETGLFALSDPEDTPRCIDQEFEYESEPLIVTATSADPPSSLGPQQVGRATVRGENLAFSVVRAEQVFCEGCTDIVRVSGHAFVYDDE